MDITEDSLRNVLPKHLAKSVSSGTIDIINNVIGSKDYLENFKDNIISFTSVMSEGKYKMSSYINAVNYVSNKLLSTTNDLAYRRTFPEKYDRWLSQGIVQKDIASYVSAYNKSKLVQALFAQTMTPSYVLNAQLYQDALNTQAILMNDENISPKVRSDAANSLLVHLKAPEAAKLEVDITLKTDSKVEELREVMKQMAVTQRRNIIEGTATVAETIEATLITSKEDNL